MYRKNSKQNGQVLRGLAIAGLAGALLYMTRPILLRAPKYLDVGTQGIEQVAQKVDKVLERQGEPVKSPYALTDFPAVASGNAKIRKIHDKELTLADRLKGIVDGSIEITVNHGDYVYRGIDRAGDGLDYPSDPAYVDHLGRGGVVVKTAEALPESKLGLYGKKSEDIYAELQNAQSNLKAIYDPLNSEKK